MVKVTQEEYKKLLEDGVFRTLIDSAATAGTSEEQIALLIQALQVLASNLDLYVETTESVEEGSFGELIEAVLEGTYEA